MVFKYPGALHIHTKYSDGTATTAEIAKYAKKAGLKWIVITDHNSLDGLKNSEEGWYDGVAVIVGEEITPEISNHYLAFGLNEVIKPNLSPEIFINEVKKQGGIGFVAHPDESSTRKNSYRPLKWDDWTLTGFDGIEIWNYLSDWVDNYDPKNALSCFIKRNSVLTGPSKKTLDWWDALNNQNFEIISAIAGSDAHALKRNHFGINVTIFPYYNTFKALINQIMLNNELSKDFNEAKNQILNALKKGQNSIINRVWDKNSLQFEFFVKNNKEIHYSGSNFSLVGNEELIIKLPKKAKIRLIHNGNLIFEKQEKEIVYNNLTDGKYRAEVYYKNHPWIFTNPININP